RRLESSLHHHKGSQSQHALPRRVGAMHPKSRSLWSAHLDLRVRSLILDLALAEIIVGGTDWRAFANAGERIELLLAHRDHAAVGAHSYRVQPLVADGKHPVSAFEF